MVSEYAHTRGRWPAVSVTLGMNGLIHVFLYYYYGMCALYPGKRPAWKKQLTQLQLIQFMVGLCHVTVGYLHHGWCVYAILYELSMIWLFSHFYYQAYIKERISVKKLEWSLFYSEASFFSLRARAGTLVVDLSSCEDIILIPYANKTVDLMKPNCLIENFGRDSIKEFLYTWRFVLAVNLTRWFSFTRLQAGSKINWNKCHCTL